jgi:hypothetical protein
MRVTSKGQVLFRVTFANGRASSPARRSSGERLVEAVRCTANKNRHLSTGKIMQFLRGDD